MDITKQTLSANHKQKMENGDNNDNKEKELVNILGGIDNILTLLLSSVDVKFDGEQLIQINKIINNNNKIVVENINEICSNDVPEEWTYYFLKNDTYIHSIFGNINGQNIFDIICSKYTAIVGVVSLIFICVLVSIHYWILIWIISFCYMIWNILIILSANRKAFKLIISSFEFWFKLFYSIQFVVAFTIWSGSAKDGILNCLIVLIIVQFSLLDVCNLHYGSNYH
eukprot:440179_1